MTKHCLILLAALASAGCAASMQAEQRGPEVKPQTGVWEFRPKEQTASWRAFSGGEAALRFRLTFAQDHMLAAEPLQLASSEKPAAAPAGDFQAILSRPAWEVPKRAFTASPGRWEGGSGHFVVTSEPSALSPGGSYRGEFKISILGEAAVSGNLNILEVKAGLVKATPNVLDSVERVQSQPYEHGSAPQYTQTASISTSDVAFEGRWLSAR